MALEFIYLALMLTGLGIMLAQLVFKPKRTEHILLAIFSGSLAMVAVKFLSADSAGPYQFIIAFGTCATCNVIWLLSRALFRGPASLTWQHFALAILIGLLVLANQTVNFIAATLASMTEMLVWLDRSLAEITNLLSSTVLTLAFWESIRGFSTASKAQKQQRVIFASVFLSGVLCCAVLAPALIPEPYFAAVFPWFVAISALSILLSTQAVVLMQSNERRRLTASRMPHSGAMQTKVVNQPDSSCQAIVSNQPPPDEADTSASSSLFERIESAMMSEKLYLLPDCKMHTLAEHLQVPEYRVSRAIREAGRHPNFNLYINSLRIAHAKQLLLSEQAKSWSVLVISLECGFASLAPFNRAFKAQHGCTPNQFRHNRCLSADMAQAEGE